MKKYKGYISVDFDATLASYTRPWKFDDLGKPQHSLIKALQHYYNRGYHINIFTGRLCTPKLEDWLDKNHVPYDGVNCQPKHWNKSSQKPYFNCIIDDKGVNFHWKYNNKSTEELIKEIDKILEWSKEGEDEN